MSHYNGHHLTWPETPIGQSTLPDQMCVTVKGFALERKCFGDFYTGAHWSPVEKDCAGVQSELTMTLYRLAKTNITEENAVNATMSMEMLTTTSEGLSPADVQYTVQILRNVASIPIIEPEVLRASVHTVDVVIEAISTSEYRDILSNLSSKITSAMENITLNTQTNERAVKVAGNNIAMYVLPLTLVPRGGVLENWGSNVTLLFNDSIKGPDERLNQFESIEAAALLPENVLTKTLSNNRTTMAMAIRKSSQLLKNLSVIIPVIDLAIGPEPVYDVDPPLEMVFKIPKINVPFRSSTKLFLGVSRNSELGSDGEDDISADSPSPTFRTTPGEGVWSLGMIWLATGPIHDGSSVESGFEPEALLPRSRGLATRPPFRWYW
ncbi:hypothetical protein AVEN_5370-1 [Araneus ventricosus]|uniref:Uncharacterized protein n=1 Tax=Araneus ventricosus TaxID=182803 RepID=A0A4Y2TQ91_ARAVE|nr:hypothetical protein AVEN_5370-1 [Araneus ventricosus]